MSHGESETEHHRVRAPILAPLSFVVTILMVAMVAGVAWVVSSENSNYVSRALSATEEIFHIEVLGDAQTLEVALEGMTRDRTLAEPLRNGDRQALLEQTSSLYQGLHHGHRVTHLYAHDVRRKVVARGHQPERFGDHIDRFTLIEAERSGAIVSGVELGPLGALTLRSVAPYRDDGKVIGYFELGEEIGHLMGRIHDALGVDVLTLIDKSKLDPAGWNDGRRVFGWPFAWSHFPSVVLTAFTTLDIPPELADRIAEAPASGGIVPITIETGARTIHAAPVPLLDFSGKRVGSLVVIVDITQISRHSHTIIAGMALLALASGGGLILLFLRIAGKVEVRVKRAMARMARSNADLERVAHVAAHHMLEPVRQVMSYSQLLERHSQAALDADGRQYLAFIMRGARRMRATVTAVKEYLELDTRDHHRQPVEVDRLVAGLLHRLRPTIEELDAKVTTEGLPTVNAYPDLLEEALFCMLDNALKFHHPDRQPVIAVTGSGSGDRWQVTVTDNGIGIASQFHDSVLEIFGRLHTPESYPGDGLGLALCRRIAELHGGRISIESQPETGSSVHFTVGRE
jgi:signal transduction histidine kinase